MPSWERVIRRGLTLCAAALVGAACGESKSASADSALATDLALAQQNPHPVIPADTALKAATPPPPKAVAARPVAARPDVPRRRPVETALPLTTPAPAAPAPAASPARGTIGAGTAIAMTIGDRICVSTAQPGDKFVAVVDQAVSGSDGAVIPAGSKVVIEVASAEKGERPLLTFRGKSVLANGTRYDLSGSAAPDSLERVRTTAAGNDAKKVLGGAALGALAGQILGKNTRATVIGGAIGAAAGTAVAARSATYDSCVPTGSKVKLVLGTPLVVTRN